MAYWPASPYNGAEGPLPETAYSQALRGGAKSVLNAPYDSYGRPSMYMGPLGPVPVNNLYYVPQILLGYPPGVGGPVDAYRAQGPLPQTAPPWGPEPSITWAQVLGKKRG